MGFWYAVVPEATQNLVTNPSAELNATGYSAKGSSAVSRSSEYQMRGQYSIKVVPTSATTDGAIYTQSGLTANTQYAAGVDFKGVNGVNYTIDVRDNTAGVNLATISFVADGVWARYGLVFTTGTNTTIQVRIYKTGSNGTGAFYIDGLQIELDHLTDYVDGDMEGGEWLASAHQSASRRKAQYSGAGRAVELSQLGFFIELAADAGLPTIQISTTAKAVGPGANFKRQALKDRTLQLGGSFQATTFRSLHSVRSEFISLVSPERFATQQPVHIRYVGSGKMLDGAFYFRDGLGGAAIHPRSGFTDKTTLQLYAPNPYFKRVSRIFTAADIAAGIGTGASGTDGAAGSNGGGGGNAGAGDDASSGSGSLTTQTNFTANYITQCGENGLWGAMGSGLGTVSLYAFTGVVSGMAVGNDGLYFYGAFTQAGGVANTSGIAKWNGSAFESVGSGTNGGVSGLAIASDGTIYAVGPFTQAGGVTAYKVARYKNGVWTGLVTIAFANSYDSVDVVVLSPDEQTLYVGGSFGSINGIGASNMAQYSITAGTWSAMGLVNSGFNSRLYTLAVTPSGRVYAGGNFTGVNGVNGYNYIAYWEGNSWHQVGGGANNDVLNMYAVGETIYLTGLFTSIGGVASPGLAKLEGSVFTSLASSIAGIANFIIYSGGVIYIGGNFSSVDGVSAVSAAYYKDDLWHSMNTGLTFNEEQVYMGAVSLSGSIYYLGDFPSMGGVTGTLNLAEWTGNNWVPIGGVRPQSIIQAADGTVYLGGKFNNAGGVSTADNIAHWTNTAWEGMGTGANGEVLAIAQGPNGYIYIGGSFISVGGVSNTEGVAYWDGTAWNPLGTGVAGAVNALAFSPNGDLYIGGLFTSANGVAGTQNLARFSGGSFTPIGTGTNGAVNALAFGLDGTLYMGGAFTTVSGVSANGIAKYNPQTGSYSSMSSGVDGRVNAIMVALDGSIYVGGSFSLAGGVSAQNITRWNGTGFLPLGLGVNNPVFTLSMDSGGILYAGGSFTQAGGIALPDKVARWGGSAWSPISLDFPGTATVYSILFTQTRAWIGFDTAGTVIANAIN